MNRFVIEQNIEAYAGRLASELDAAQRAKLKTLLIEEEKRFGVFAEAVGEIDRDIAKCQDRISEQRNLLEGLRSHGEDFGAAQRGLLNLDELLGLFQRWQQEILTSLARHPVQHAAGAQAWGKDRYRLTEREREVLGLIACGNSSEDAAGVLGITKRTIDAHVQLIIHKLDAANRTQAVAIALGAGLIELRESKAAAAEHAPSFGAGRHQAG